MRRRHQAGTIRGYARILTVAFSFALVGLVGSLTAAHAATFTQLSLPDCPTGTLLDPVTGLCQTVTSVVSPSPSPSPSPTSDSGSGGSGGTTGTVTDTTTTVTDTTNTLTGSGSGDGGGDGTGGTGDGGTSTSGSGGSTSTTTSSGGTSGGTTSTTSPNQTLLKLAASSPMAAALLGTNGAGAYYGNYGGPSYFAPKGTGATKFFTETYRKIYYTSAFGGPVSHDVLGAVVSAAHAAPAATTIVQAPQQVWLLVPFGLLLLMWIAYLILEPYDDRVVAAALVRS